MPSGRRYDFVPNFRIKLPRCIFTVTSLIERSFATCLLMRSDATSVITYPHGVSEVHTARAIQQSRRSLAGLDPFAPRWQRHQANPEFCIGLESTSTAPAFMRFADMGMSPRPGLK